MKPYYEENRIRIYNADCREWLASVPECFGVDLVLTDPPYGIGLDYEDFNDTEDAVMGIATYFNEIIPRAKRTLLTCATRQIGWYPKPDWILCWLNRAGAYMNPWGFTCWQPVLAYGSDPYLENSLGSRPDVIEHSETAENNGHPCPKPLGFWKKLLMRGSVSAEDIVLDPFMGSGTTALVARANGCKAIGVELNPNYIEIAAKRLSQEVFDFSLDTPKRASL